MLHDVASFTFYPAIFWWEMILANEPKKGCFCFCGGIGRFWRQTFAKPSVRTRKLMAIRRHHSTMTLAPKVSPLVSPRTRLASWLVVGKK